MKKLFTILALLFLLNYSQAQITQKCINITSIDCPFSICIEQTVRCTENSCVCNCNNINYGPSISCTECEPCATCPSQFPMLCFYYLDESCTCCDCSITTNMSVTNCLTGATETIHPLLVANILNFFRGTYIPPTPNQSIDIAHFNNVEDRCNGHIELWLWYNSATGLFELRI